MIRKKVLLASYYGKSDSNYYHPFSEFGELETDVNLLWKQPNEIVLVVFTGGEDVTPSYYGESANRLTQYNPQRDSYESAVFKKAVELKKPIAGICRGSQLICALSGGKLAQHINGHTRPHVIRTDDGRPILVSSTHHQMQIPPQDAIPVAWAEPKLSNCYLGPPGIEYHPDKEHDVVFYPKTNALGMQYHPEFMESESDGYKYCGELIRRFFKLPSD